MACAVRRAGFAWVVWEIGVDVLLIADSLFDVAFIQIQRGRVSVLCHVCPCVLLENNSLRVEWTAFV